MVQLGTLAESGLHAFRLRTVSWIGNALPGLNRRDSQTHLTRRIEHEDSERQYLDLASAASLLVVWLAVFTFGLTEVLVAQSSPFACGPNRSGPVFTIENSSTFPAIVGLAPRLNLMEEE